MTPQWGTKPEMRWPSRLLWSAVEAAFARLYRIRRVGEEADALFAVSPARHRGAPVTLADGAVIQPGDPLLEVHFRRETMLQLAELEPRLGVLGLRRLARRDTPLLAALLAEGGPYEEVVALHALSLFERPSRRMGWEARDVEPPLARWWFSLYLRMLLARDHRWGAARLRQRPEALVARHLWMSRQTLLDRWLEPAGVDQVDTAPGDAGDSSRSVGKIRPLA